MILTRDKTIIADALIDDNPDITGSCTPSWRDIVFDQPYNRSMAGARLRRWEDWREVLEPPRVDLARLARAPRSIVGIGI